MSWPHSCAILLMQVMSCLWGSNREYHKVLLELLASGDPRHVEDLLWRCLGVACGTLRRPETYDASARSLELCSRLQPAVTVSGPVASRHSLRQGIYRTMSGCRVLWRQSVLQVNMPLSNCVVPPRPVVELGTVTTQCPVVISVHAKPTSQTPSETHL